MKYGSLSMSRSLFSFPDPVNEHAARLVAGGVAAMSAMVVVADQHWVLVPLTFGFWARALTGPTLSPLGQLVTGVVIPLLGRPARPVPGRPKRVAQCIGAALSTGALIAWSAGALLAATTLTAMILVAASLEAGLGLCLGCVLHGWLSRAGIAPNACQECADISRSASAPASQQTLA